MLEKVSDTYRSARRAMATAYDRQKDADFHQWRKAIEDHSGHIRQLADVWPEEMQGRLEVLEHLGSLLGEDQDLSVFAGTLSGDAGLEEREQPVVLGRIEQRQHALRAMARPLGRRLFAEPPAAFKRRLHWYWKTWRDRGDASQAHGQAA
jgi:hypothetical protein